MGFFGGVFWLAILAAFVGLVAWAVYTLIHNERRTAGPVGPFPPGPPPVPPQGPFSMGPPPAPGWGIHHDDALNAARVRYARGEIDREQYFRVVEDLTGVPRPAPSVAGASSPSVPSVAGAEGHPVPAPGLTAPMAPPTFPPGPRLPRPDPGSNLGPGTGAADPGAPPVEGPGA
ncbi:MAG TPA: hypothetical protein VHA57_10505 [Actinomycetota bacterium]|nr:hypothetical protein [Actinomycetota bacterium]